MNPNDSSLVIGVTIIVVVFVLAMGYLVSHKEVPDDATVPWNGKFLLVPGPVISQTDGQEHFVTAGDLTRLYGVSAKDCVVRDERYPAFGAMDFTGYVVLRPQYDGDYNIIRAFADANVLLPGEQHIQVYA